jgi:hypothetical protein
MDPIRKAWNDQQQALRQALENSGDHTQAIDLFLRQHAALHTAAVSRTGLYSFEDDIWLGLSEAHTRSIPPGFEHSIAWIFWHLTRIEDVTMNVLVAGGQQVFLSGGWLPKLGVTLQDTGNAMSPETIAALSASLNIAELRAYRIAVGQSTRRVVQELSPQDLKKKVDPGRLQRLLEEGAVEPAASGLLEYWGGLTITGLLLMPPTRHIFVHFTEAQRIKGKLI